MMVFYDFCVEIQGAYLIRIIVRAVLARHASGSGVCRPVRSVRAVGALVGTAVAGAARCLRRGAVVCLVAAPAFVAGAEFRTALCYLLKGFCVFFHSCLRSARYVRFDSFYAEDRVFRLAWIERMSFSCQMLCRNR